jgi:hypothetical protein
MWILVAQAHVQTRRKAGGKMKSFFRTSLAVAAAGLIMASGSVKPLRAATLAAPMSYLQDRDDRRWEEPPSEFDEYARRGYHDGIEGARKDYGNHRSQDPRHRDEFRHPHVPGEFREAYRRGFERGYNVGWDHIMHEERH